MPPPRSTLCAAQSANYAWPIITMTRAPSPPGWPTRRHRISWPGSPTLTTSASWLNPTIAWQALECFSVRAKSFSSISTPGRSVKASAGSFTPRSKQRRMNGNWRHCTSTAPRWRAPSMRLWDTGQSERRYRASEFCSASRIPSGWRPNYLSVEHLPDESSLYFAHTVRINSTPDTLLYIGGSRIERLADGAVRFVSPSGKSIYERNRTICS